jgi:nucleoside 2-deoxyribosyltransferase
MGQGALPRTATLSKGLSKGLAFMAMPFNSHFDSWETHIKNAVLKAGFTPYRTDQNLSEEDWLEAIYQRTRQADIFIAVCSPEPASKAPNANVMYELGFADCLGTPTILVTTNASALPSDLKTRNALTYSKRNPRAFEDELCSRILARTAETDRRSGRAVTGPEAILWHSLVVVSYVTKIHHGFQLLSALDPAV